MAVALMAVNAAGLSLGGSESSSSSDTTMTVPTIDLNRGKSLRRRSEDLRGMLDSETEEDQQVFAVPIKGSRVMTDWVCSCCSAKLIVDIAIKHEAPEKPEDSPGDDTSPLHHLDDTVLHIEPTTFKNRLWLVMEITDTMIPPYPLASRIVAALGLLFIVISVVNFVIETHPDYYINQPRSIFVIESICMGYFTLELILRLGSTPDRKLFLWDKYTVIDVVSILPFYISLFVGEDSAKGFLVLRILRLMRVFRIFKVTKYNEAVNMVLGSLKNSTEGLYLLLFLIFISTVLFSSTIYFVEREYLFFDENDETWYLPVSSPNNTALRSPFQSILHASWWCLVTLTTVGYGDEVPSSTAGKMVAAATMLCGTLVIAFPMVIIGQNFQDTYRVYKKKQSKEAKKNKWKILTRPKNFDRLPLDGTISHLLQSQSVIHKKEHLGDKGEPQTPPVRITKSNSTLFTPRVQAGNITPKPVKRISQVSQIDLSGINGMAAERTVTGDTNKIIELGMESPRVTIPPLTFRRRGATKVGGKFEKCTRQIDSLEERLEALIRAKQFSNGKS